MTTQNQIDKLSAALIADKEKVTKLQHTIKEKEAKLKELQKTQIFDDLNVLSARGIDTKAIVEAMKSGDVEKLASLTHQIEGGQNNE